MYLEIFLADFAVFRVFLGISRKYLNFAGPRPHEISEALFLVTIPFLSTLIRVGHFRGKYNTKRVLSN